MNAVAMLAGVIITFSQTGPVACPQAAPAITRNADGTYARFRSDWITLPSCTGTTTWREEWTDYPEKGGKYVRDVDGDLPWRLGADR